MQIVKKYWLGLVVVVLFLIAGMMIYAKLHPKLLPENLVQGTGRIDGDLINLNTKYPGRVSKIVVDDGVIVKRGMILAQLDSKEQEAQKAQIEAQIDAQRKALKAKKIEAQITQKTIPLAVKKAQAQLNFAHAQLKALQKGISVQESLLAQAQRDYKRSRFLFDSKAIDKHTLELSKLKMDNQGDKLDALKAQLSQVKETISIAQIGLKEAEASQKKLLSIKAGIAGFEAEIKALEASKAQVDAMLSELTLKSPVDGYTVEKIANEGEVIGTGMPVATLIDPHSLYLKIFVDTIQNGKIKLGDKAVIFLDAYPDRPMAAKVVNIAQRAEFTPKEVSVRSDRIQRVYAVHLKPIKVDPLLKLGIPAIGVVSMDGKGLPDSLDELPVL
jgi:HlyD family secretion protein